MENLILIASSTFVAGLLIASLVVWFISKQKINLATRELELVKGSYENVIVSLKDNIKNLEESLKNQEISFQEKVTLENLMRLRFKL